MAKPRAKDTEAKYREILTRINQKIYKPIYLLMGDEAYYIDQLSSYIAANILNEPEKAFNQTILYGKDVDVTAIINAARRFPMMANHQVIIVKEAQNVRKIEELDVYVKAPLQSTILVICLKGKTVDKRGAFYKTVDKIGDVLETVKLYENEVSPWITTYVQQQGYSMEPAASAVMADYVGNDLSKLVNELDKLFSLLPTDRKKLAVSDIEQNIGISKEYNTFELNNAVAQRNILKANRIAYHFGKNPSEYPLVVTISTLYTLFRNLLKLYVLKKRAASQSEIASELGVNPFFVKDYETAVRLYPIGKIIENISLLREYDMRGKGFGNTSVSHEELLRELLFKLLH
ncbi:MAG: DNA polymerase III subunit delta [Prevotellaceae bacterium]|jgi:DNA polymerase-3 subunit delta|nr:DNA polymerase III subunit delta [Prevotellaceae bacterium]